MTLDQLPLMALAAGIAVVAAAIGQTMLVLTGRDPNPEIAAEGRPYPLGALIALGALTAAASVFSLAGISDPVNLVVISILLVALFANVITDLRSHAVYIHILLAATALVTGIRIVQGLIDPSSDGALSPLIGMAVTAGPSYAMQYGGALMARVFDRGNIDPTTGEQAEGYGSGDTYTLLLVGAALGPWLGFLAFLVGIIAHGLLVAIPAAVAKYALRRDITHVPMLPGLAVGLVLVVSGTVTFGSFLFGV